MRSGIKWAGIAVLAVSALFWRSEPLDAAEPIVYSVVEGTATGTGDVAIVVIGKKVSKFKVFDIEDDQGASLGAPTLTFKSKTILVLTIPGTVTPGIYDLMLGTGKNGSVFQSHTVAISNGGVLPDTVVSESLQTTLRDDLGDADTLGGSPASFFLNSSNHNAGTLSTDRFSALSDLTAESGVGTGGGQVAAGNHSHSTPFVNETGDTMSGSLTVNSSGSPAVLGIVSGTGFTIGVQGAASSTAGVGVYGSSSSTTGSAYGVQGSTNSSGGIGVFGSASAATGGTGVRGESHTPTGTAVAGSNASSTGSAYGISGLSGSTAGRAVRGLAYASTGSTVGVEGSASSPSGTGVYGTGGNFGVQGLGDIGVEGTSSDTAGRGVDGIATATSGTTYGVRGESASSSGYGVFGTNSALTGSAYGGRFETGSTDGIGVQGHASSTTGFVRGVYGTAAGTSGVGVFGSASSSTGSAYGVQGTTSSSGGIGVFGSSASTGGTGVWGQNSATTGSAVVGSAAGSTGTTYGVRGQAGSASGYGVYGWNYGGGFAVYAAGDLHVTGNQTVSGTKSFVQQHPTNPDQAIVYVCLEGGEAGTYCRGSGDLVFGEAVIDLPEHFSLVTSPAGITAQVTVNGDCNGVFVVERTNTRLVVRELNGGLSNASFDWTVNGVRLGYEDHEVISSDPVLLKALSGETPAFATEAEEASR